MASTGTAAYSPTFRVIPAAGSIVKRDENGHEKAVLENAQVRGRASGSVLHAER
jgi:hypothetical protein